MVAGYSNSLFSVDPTGIDCGLLAAHSPAFPTLLKFDALQGSSPAAVEIPMNESVAAPTPTSTPTSLDPDRIHFAYFAYQPEQKRLELVSERSSGPARAPEEGPEQASIAFGLGAEGGLLGQVSETGRSLSVDDCGREPGWALGGGFGSALLLPVGRECPCDVIVLSSHALAAFSARDAAIAATVVECCAQIERYNAQQALRVRGFEQSLRRIAIELSELGIETQSRGYSYPRGLAERLRLVSPREWEVLERLRVGLRVATIANELSISPNTVRNHLKSIYRKLGVRSQLELLERLRGAS